MTQRENFRRMLDGKEPEFCPIYYDLYKACSLADNQIFHPPADGLDVFGVEWVHTSDGSMPKTGNYLFTDIARWPEYVHFPDLDYFDFQAMAHEDLADVDRNDKVINVNFAVGLFQRMVAFMGFEETLCALIEEPEACDEFFGEMADFNISCINRMIDAYQPDVLTYFDDFATAQSLFISPATFREVMEPHHKRIIEAINARGVICAEHLCGKCDDIVDDLVNMGVTIWSSAQVQNDIQGIEQKYKGELIVEGGWDSFGSAGQPGATTEEILREADRCMKEYGQERNYILFPIILADKLDPRIAALREHWKKISKY